MILLTDEEIDKMVPGGREDFEPGVYYYYSDGIRDGAKAQLKKVVNEWDGYGEYAGCKLIPMGEWQALLEETQ